MARPRDPKAIADAKGASAKNPQRYRDRADASKVSPRLGGPSAWLEKLAKEKRGEDDRYYRTVLEAWEGYRAELPWLLEAHRALVEAAALSRAKIMTGAVTSEAIREHRLCLKEMGASPTTDSKVSVDMPDDPDQAAASKYGLD